MGAVHMLGLFILSFLSVRNELSIVFCMESSHSFLCRYAGACTAAAFLQVRSKCKYLAGGL